MPAGPDTSRLAPADCVVALRSYSRRAGDATAAVDGDEDADAIAHVGGADGLSAVDHLDAAARAVEMLGQALRTTLVQDRPTVPEAVLDEWARTWAVAGGADDLATVVGHFGEATADLAALAEGEAGGAEGWDRTATVSGTGATTTALDILREAVRTGAAAIRAAEAAVAAARR